MNLNQYFIETYAYDGWYYKKVLLEFLIEHLDELKELPYFPKIMNWVGYETDTKPKTIPTDSETIRETLMAEYFATILHTTESLFALIRAVNIDVNRLWELLVEYKPENIIEFTNRIIREGLTDDEVKGAFYVNLNFEIVREKYKESYEKIINNIAWIKKYLSKLAEWYIQNKRFYNCYKHAGNYFRGNLEATIIPPELEEWFEEEGRKLVVGYPENLKNSKTVEPHITLLTYRRMKEIYNNNYDLIKKIIFTLRQLIDMRRGKAKGLYLTLFYNREIDSLFPLKRFQAKINLAKIE